MAKLIEVLLLGLLAILCQGDETKVKWTDWCSECKCANNVDSMIIDCTKTFPPAPQTWPKEFVEDEHATNKSLMVTIHFTTMKKLLPFPEMKSKRVTMSLQNCQIEEISSAAFKNIKNIYFLSLAFNRLTGEAMRAEIFKGPYDNNLYEPIDLEVLHLESNLIHSLDRKIFEHTPKLRRLYLFNNPLGVLDDVTILALASLKNLQLLDLSYTGISYLPDDLMRNTKSLQDLRLSGNKFKTVPESLGSVGSSLRWLTLNKNNIEQIDDNSFLGLWRLEHLEMGNMDELRRVKAGAFAQLRSLTMLHMVHNKNLREIDHDAFRELKKNWPIQELYLQDNSLETLPADLAPWGQLHSVNLENNNWICDCRMAINIKTKGIWRKIPLTSNARCTTPTAMGGVKLVDLNPDTLCSANERNNITFGPPRYPLRSITRRSGSILVALGFVCSVVVLGLSIGCCLSYLRNKLKKVTFVEEVRYSHLIT